LRRILRNRRINGNSAGSVKNSVEDRDIITAARKVAEPIAWAKKYFIAASVSWFVEDRVNSGIIERRFSSILPHITIQLFLDKAIRVESPRVDVNRREKGNMESIKIEEESNLLHQN
jgi:hypothetical protein